MIRVHVQQLIILLPLRPERQRRVPVLASNRRARLVGIEVGDEIDIVFVESSRGIVVFDAPEDLQEIRAVESS